MIGFGLLGATFPGQYGDEGQCEIAPGWEYIGVDKEISEIVRETSS